MESLTATTPTTSLVPSPVSSPAFFLRLLLSVIFLPLATIRSNKSPLDRLDLVAVELSAEPQLEPRAVHVTLLSLSLSLSLSLQAGQPAGLIQLKSTRPPPRDPRRPDCARRIALSPLDRRLPPPTPSRSVTHARHPRRQPPAASRRGGPRSHRIMGSFKGHVLPGTLFLLVGLWRVWSAVARFAADPSAFRVRAWNPVGSSDTSPLRLLELYVIAGGAFADMCVEVFYSTHLRIFADGGVNPAHLNDLEHGGMLLMFFLFGALALLSQKTRYLPLSEGALCLVAATAFTAEFALFYFHSTTHMGLEGYYHYLLVVLVGLCIASAVLGALLPASFPVDLATGVLIALQGLWFYQTAFTLYGSMLPAGCARDAVGSIECRGRAAQERAEQLANFQLFGLVFLAFLYVLGCYAVAAAKYGHPDLITMHEKHVAAALEMDCARGDAAAGAAAGEECAI